MQRVNRWPDVSLIDRMRLFADTVRMQNDFAPAVAPHGPSVRRRAALQEQDHFIELATALGEDPPNISG